MPQGTQAAVSPPSKSCLDCGASLAGAHPNRKRCEPCAAAKVRRPTANLTLWQQDMLRSMINVYTHDEMAERIGVSRATVRRWFREQGLRSHATKYGDDVVQAVLGAYVEHGKTRTQELFPDVAVRSIVERHEHAPRQVRWLDHELTQAARMAGLVRHSAQAVYFNRPNAYGGSIKSLWVKRFGCAPSEINGLSVELAWRLAHPGVVGTLVY